MPAGGSSSGRPPGRACAAGIPNTLVGVATRRSVAMANWAPAPSAGPSIAAITGTDRRPNPRSTAARSVANWPSSTPLRSAPALNAGGLPVRTTARIAPGVRAAIAAWTSRSSSSVA